MRQLACLSLIGTVFAFTGCSSDSAAVSEASCCSSSHTYTAQECSDIGNGAGCDSASLTSDNACNTPGCVFADCDKKPTCR